MKSFGKWMMLAAVLAGLPCAASAQTLVNERSISTNAALELATAALDACRKHGSVVTITVLDRADRVVVQVRDDGASPHSVEHSLRKAHTALTYNMPRPIRQERCSKSRQRGTAPPGQYDYCSRRDSNTRGHYAGRRDWHLGHARGQGRRHG